MDHDQVSADRGYPRVRRATAADLDGMARCHELSFPGYFMTEMGPGWLRALYRHFIQHEQGIAVVVTDEADEVLGFAVGGAATIRAEFLRTALYRYPHLIIGKFVTVGIVRRKLSREILRRFSPGRQEAQTATTRPPQAAGARVGDLLSIGVFPHSQGSGAAGKLIGYFGDLCAEAGYTVLELSVEADNLRAVAFYKKLGWKVVCQYDDDLWFRLDLASA